MQALQDHDTVIKVIDAVVAGTEKFSEVTGMKTSITLNINVTKKLVQRRFSTGELGKGNSEKMCLQPAPEGAECL